jgi:hypothetical protein
MSWNAWTGRKSEVSPCSRVVSSRRGRGEAREAQRGGVLHRPPGVLPFARGLLAKIDERINQVDRARVWAAMRERTSLNQAWGSTPTRWHDATKLRGTAARYR